MRSMRRRHVVLSPAPTLTLAPNPLHTLNLHLSLSLGRIRAEDRVPDMKWFLAVLLTLLTALVLQTGLLAYAMYVLLGLLLVGRLLARAGVGNLSAHRERTPETAEIGETISVRLTVQNHGALPVPWVLLEDLLPAAQARQQ